MRSRLSPRGTSGGGNSPALARAVFLSLMMLIAIAWAASLPAGAGASHLSDDTAATAHSVVVGGEAASSAGDLAPAAASLAEAESAVHPSHRVFASATGLGHVYSISRSSTTATLRIRLAGSTSTSRTLHIRHQESSTYPGGSWTTTTYTLPANKNEIDVTVTGLDYKTGYRAEVSLDSNFTTAVSTTFTTRSAPSPSWIGMMNITGTTATAYVTYSGSGPATIYLRYKEAGEASWESTILEAVTGGAGNVYVSVAMTGLDASTGYTVEVTFDTSDWRPSRQATFTTKSASYTLPAASSVTANRITACSARLNMSFPNPDGNSHLVYFRWKKDVSGASWSSPRPYTTAGTSPSIQIGLRPSTTYVAQGSLDLTFSSGTATSAPFTTTSSPYVSNVVADPVGTTTATLTGTRTHFCQTFPAYHFRYRIKGTATWTEIESASEGHSRFRYLTGLTPDTTYEVEASFYETFAHPYKIEFRTLPLVPDPPVPSLVAINLVEAKRTELTVVVKTVDAEADTEVHLLHQNLRSDTFSTQQSASVTSNEARFPLSGLVSGTRYRLWASLDQSLLTDTLTPATKPDDVLSAEFTTLPPGVLGVAARTTGQTSATLTVTIVEPNGQDQSVYTQFRTTNPEGNWTNTWDQESDIPKTKTDTATVNVTGLTSDTEYEARASLDNTFPEDETKVSNTFRTWPPGVEGLSVKDITQNSATVVVELSAANGSILYMIYRPVGGTWAGTQQTVVQGQTSVEFPLTGLMSGTEYEVRFSYDARLLDLVGQSTPRGLGSQSEKTTRSDRQRSVPKNQGTQKDDSVEFNELVFSTLPPSVVSVTVDDQTVGQTGATVTVTVKEPNGTDEVHIRYSTDSNFPNGSTETAKKGVPTTTNSNGEDTTDFVLTGLSEGSTYYVEASYDDTFPDSDATKSISFDTVNAPSITDVTASTLTQTGATVTVTVEDPDGTAVQLHYRAGTGIWNTADPNGAVFDGNANTYTFTLSGLMSGTAYTVYGSFGSSPPSSGDTLEAAQSDTFSTLDPNITDVEVDDASVTQTAATVAVTVDEPNSTPLQLHYKKDSESSWSGPMSAIADSGTGKATFALSGLTSGSAYTVYGSYDSTAPASGTTLAAVQTDSFTTDPPSVEKVEVTAQTDTTATVKVTVSEPNGESQTVSVRYQTTPSGNWVTIQPDPTTSSDSVIVNLSNLSASTQYKVEATLSGDTNQVVKSVTFTTNSTGPGVSGVAMSGETQTGASATVTIANPGTSARTVYLHYRESGSDSWSDPPLEGMSTTAVPGTATIDLTGLISGTLYEVQASLDNTFASGVQSATFWTLGPSASAVAVLEENPTTAKVRVTVSEPNGKTPLFLRYGNSGNWRREFAPDVDTGTVDFTLSGLTPDTSYTVEASYDSNFPSDATATATFDTPHLDTPTVEVPDPGQTTAGVDITVSSPSNQDGVVYHRYKETSSSTWSNIQAAVLSGGSATANLSGLTSGTEYRVEAALSRSFPADATGSKTFTTDPPSVDKVEVTAKTETTAEITVTIAASNGDSQTVDLDYDTTANTEQGTWGNSEPGSSSTDTAIITLTGLTPGTQYTVRAALTDDINGETRSATFTTTSSDPHVSGVELDDEDIDQTGATATITIANVTAATDVFLRYRTSPSGVWSDPVLEATSTAADPLTATIDLTGLTSGTQYVVQASLDNTFTTGVQTATFTTKPPAVSAVTVTGRTQTTATVKVEVSAPNGDPVYLQYRTGTGAWTGLFKTVAVDQVSVDFVPSGLASNSTYTVQASYDSAFPDTDATKSATFTTARSSSTGNPGGSPGDDTEDDPVGPQPANSQPTFTDGVRTFRSVAENTPPGEKVGAPIPVNDGDGDQLSFALVQSLDSERFTVSAVSTDPVTGITNVVAGASGLVGADFDVDDTITNAVQILTHTQLDYENRNVYLLTILVADGMDGQGEADLVADTSILVTVLVTDLEEEGTVTLSAATPRVGEALTAAVADPDGGVTGIGWVWERSQDRSRWVTIDGATSDTYTPVADDEGHYLKATVSYTDRRGPSKTASAESDKPVAVGFDEEFTDVDDSNEHVDAIEDLASRGIFIDTECGDQLFCPHLGLKRWEMAVWILRVLVDYPDNIVGISRFQDIPDGKWWIRYVEHLYDRKITIGCDTEPLRYCPDRLVTRAQMASFLVRALNLPPAPPAGFTDTDRTVHAPNIDALDAAGITIGCDTEPLRYCPDEAVTRAQMATFLYRMAPWLDRHALIALYNATNGANWTNNTNWATTEPIDQWYGVQTDQSGAVTSLLLAGNGLHGPIPHALTNLPRLQTLELSANVLTGCIPQPLQDIPNSDLTKLGLVACG